MCWVFSLTVAAGAPGCDEALLLLSASVSPSIERSQQQWFISDE